MLLIGVWLGGHPSWLPSSVRGTFVDNSNGQFVNQVLDELSKRLLPADQPRVSWSTRAWRRRSPASTIPTRTTTTRPPTRSFLDQDNPHLNGIGIDVQNEPRACASVDVFDESPASKAGLARGDVIVAVGVDSLANRSADFGSKLIRAAPAARSR